MLKDMPFYPFHSLKEDPMQLPADGAGDKARPAERSESHFILVQLSHSDLQICIS